MKLYLVRHGESENNASGLWTGWQNPSLTEKGIADARCARKLLADEKFDKVYSSDLLRAQQTAEEMLPGCTPTLTGLLREIDVGNLAGRNHAECAMEYGESLKQNQKDVNYEPYGGESTQAFDARLSEFLKTAENCGGKTVAAFAHAGVLRRMWRIVTDTPLDNKVLLRNCATLVLEQINGVWCVHSLMNM